MLSDFKARHVLNLEVAAQRKISKPPCQPELPKLEISQQTRNLSNDQSVQSAPATIPPGHTFKFVFILELVSKELNHFGVIAGLFRQIEDHSSRFVLFCSF